MRIARIETADGPRMAVLESADDARLLEAIESTELARRRANRPRFLAASAA
jgi:hypothetical protein